VGATSTCLGCGCVCDDIQLHVEGNRIVEARNACSLGATWFGDGSAPARVRVRGRDSSLADAITAGAGILSVASRPLIFLATDISCEVQRAAIAIADRVRGTIDTVTSATTRATLIAAQETGRVSATLGEIRNRADVIVFWGVDPAHRYPRFAARYAPDPTGLYVGGRRDRTIVAVDVGDARGPDDADSRLTVMPVREVATISELTAAVRSSREMAPFEPLLRGKYVAIVVDAEPDERSGTRDTGRTAALLALAQALNDSTRCALIALRAGGNRSGADASLTAQTGFPMAVDFSRGYPRYRPYDDAARRVERRTVDAMLIVGAAASVPPTLLEGMAALPTVIIGPRAAELASTAAVAIDTGVAGIHESGTALRMDDVPLPLAAAIAGPPSTLDVVAALVGRI